MSDSPTHAGYPIRALKHFVCRLLVGVMLLTQASVASYACARLPGTATALQLQSAGVGAVVGEDTAGIADLDPQARGDALTDVAPIVPNLCVGHCQSGNQGTVQPAAKVANAAPPATLYLLPDFWSVSESGVITIATAVHGSPVAADPPHAILHCCLRD